mgnify:CR=1 FL=1
MNNISKILSFYNFKLLNDYKAGFIFKITTITLSRNVIYQEYFDIHVLLLLPIHWSQAWFADAPIQMARIIALRHIIVNSKI